MKLLNKCSAVSRALTATMAELVRDQLDELVSGKGNLPGAFFSDMYILLQRLNVLLKTD